ncbi:hypothetical protein [Nonlabens agnitus]|uniref:Secretion system C-terminal sorting domain-containing protein n=1 Tax=Nonlabens agnitus TaxID=870484 RepID=A0A2S9WSE6_9FLAO|nr:hypothetical protein [Nonlabens agnitus]PRP66400.1 hypothetical protein BST86_04485 [Nonlabens agnitus]
MKTLKHIVLTALMLTALNGYSTEIEIVSSASVTTLQFSNVKKGQQIMIKDGLKTVLYKEFINTSGTYLRKFDLTALKDGMYFIELHKDCEIIIKSLYIENNNVMIIQDSESKEFKPVLKLNKGTVMISQLTLAQKPLSISFYYDGELIHEETLSGSMILNGAYQLSTDKKGDYVVFMKSGDRTYTNNFTL